MVRGTASTIGSTDVHPDLQLLAQAEAAYIEACRRARRPLSWDPYVRRLPDGWRESLATRLAAADAQFAFQRALRLLSDQENERGSFRAALVSWHARLAMAQARCRERPDYRIGRYLIRHTLVHTRSGTLYRCYDPLCARDVTVKIPVGRELRGEAALVALRAEAVAAASVFGGWLPVVLDASVGRATAYLVRQYIRGCPLTSLNLPVPLSTALRWVVQLLRVLGTLHRSGRVHTRLEPRSLLVGRDGLWLVGTRHIHRVGTTRCDLPEDERYRPPEAALEAPADPRWNVFQCGRLLAELVGRGQERIELCGVQTDQRLAEICARAVAQAPRDRYPTANALLRALRGALGVARWP